MSALRTHNNRARNRHPLGNRRLFKRLRLMAKIFRSGIASARVVAFLEGVPYEVDRAR